MDLTDQQWNLVRPIISNSPELPERRPELAESRSCIPSEGSGRRELPEPTKFQLAGRLGGRPPIDPRPVLDAILWKLRNNAPWSDLPDRYPSHQTCYRRYRDWCRDRLLDRILITLFDDLLQRGQFDPRLALLEKAIIVTHQGSRCRILTSTELLDTWQLSTALVYIQLALTHLRSPKEQPG